MINTTHFETKISYLRKIDFQLVIFTLPFLKPPSLRPAFFIDQVGVVGVSTQKIVKSKCRGRYLYNHLIRYRIYLDD